MFKNSFAKSFSETRKWLRRKSKNPDEITLEGTGRIPEQVLEVPVQEIPKKAVEGSHIDPRLIVRLGKRGKAVFMKTPCVGECADCPKQFEPVPPEAGKTFCKVYPNPAAMWAGLNPDSKPKTCLGLAKPKAEKEEKEKKPLNPLKASKRGAAQRGAQPQVPAVVTSKESRKKKKENKKKKMERRDSR